MQIVEKLLLLSSVLYVCTKTFIYNVGAIPATLHYLTLGCILLSASFFTLFPLAFSNELKLLLRCGLNGSLYTWMLPFVLLTNSLSESNVSANSKTDIHYELAVLGVTQLICVHCISTNICFTNHLPHSWTSLTLISCIINIPTLLCPEIGVHRQLLLGILSVMFLGTVLNIFTWFPQTFSFGEGVIVCQALNCAMLWLMSCLEQLLQTKDEMIQLNLQLLPHDYIAVVAAVSLSLPMVVHVALRCIGPCGVTFYSTLTLTLAAAVLSPLYCGHVPMLFAAILGSYTQIFTWLYWLWISSGAIFLVILYNKKGWRVTTTDRKYFHVIAVLIFLPGILMTPELTKLASILAFCAFMLAEFIRYERMPPIGSALNQSLSLFLDKQDSGSLVLTHIYLLCGCALPLWLLPQSHLPAIGVQSVSGIMSLGIGDSFASIVGSRFGSIHYPGSRKTVEGTAAAWLSMAIFSYWLFLPPVDEMATLSWKLVMIAVLESSTQQVDNLVLPLYSFIMLSRS